MVDEFDNTPETRDAAAAEGTADAGATKADATPDEGWFARVYDQLWTQAGS